jgi:hypothetical protein
MWCHSPKKLLAGVVSTIALSAVLTVPAGATGPADRWWEESNPAIGQSNCLESALTPVANSGIVGNAELCLGEQGVRASVQADNLSDGNAYTTWMVYFDHPSDCSAKPCTPADAVGDDPAGVVSRIDGLIADGGPETFAGMYRNLRLSRGGEVHIPIFSHGVASADDHRALARQLLTPQDPGLGVMGGAPADGALGAPVAVAIFYVP